MMDDVQHVIAATLRVDRELHTFLSKLALGLRRGDVTAHEAADALDAAANALRDSISRRGELV